MRQPSDWIAYWNAAPPIYSGMRHKFVHYLNVADDIVRHIDGSDWQVLDYGCGDALSAERVAAVCGRLILIDGGETVRAGLIERCESCAKIVIAAPEDVERVADVGSLDLIVINSVVQYLTTEDLIALMRRLKPMLSPQGTIIVADVVPPDASPVHDAAALMVFAARHGFIVEAVVGLFQTFISDYRRVRERLGFSQYTEAAFLSVMSRAGFECCRIQPNFGHNQRRMAFRATTNCTSADQKTTPGNTVKTAAS